MLPQATFQNSLELPKNITRSKKNITRFQISGFLNSLRPFTPMLPQATPQNLLEFCEIKKKRSSLQRLTVFQFSRNFLGHLQKKKKDVFHLVNLLSGILTFYKKFTRSLERTTIH